VRDFAEVRHDGNVTSDIARAGLELFEVDEQGLDKLDLAILSTVVEKFGGGPVGLSTLSAAVGEETDTIEDVVEPYLLQLGCSSAREGPCGHRACLPPPRRLAGRGPPARLSRRHLNPFSQRRTEP
jgi:Holliday junction DNA helicase RuvB